MADRRLTRRTAVLAIAGAAVFGISACTDSSDPAPSTTASVTSTATSDPGPTTNLGSTTTHGALDPRDLTDLPMAQRLVLSDGVAVLAAPDELDTSGLSLAVLQPEGSVRWAKDLPVSGWEQAELREVGDAIVLLHTTREGDGGRLHSQAFDAATGAERERSELDLPPRTGGYLDVPGPGNTGGVVTLLGDAGLQRPASYAEQVTLDAQGRLMARPAEAARLIAGEPGEFVALGRGDAIMVADAPVARPAGISSAPYAVGAARRHTILAFPRGTGAQIVAYDNATGEALAGVTCSGYPTTEGSRTPWHEVRRSPAGSWLATGPAVLDLSGDRSYCLEPDATATAVDEEGEVTAIHKESVLTTDGARGETAVAPLPADRRATAAYFPDHLLVTSHDMFDPRPLGTLSGTRTPLTVEFEQR